MPVPFLKRHGHKLLSNGYEVIPISPGTKEPHLKGWRSLERITHKRVDRWLSNGHARDGIGIRSKYTPMVDIDSLWEPCVTATVKRAERIVGYAPLRIGAAPKTGLIYRTTVPFKKVQSKAFTDPNGNKAQLEIQGDGQQWVAYHTHPETKKPYTWPEKNFNILEVEHDDLVEITEEKAVKLVQWFEKWCIDQGWSLWKSKSQSTALTTRAARDPDDIGGVTQLGIPTSEVAEWCERLRNDDSVEYEDNFNLDPEVPNYRNVIFAIWHETEGSEEGREIALAWSEKSTKHNEDPLRFGKLWNSADPEDMDTPITFRYVIKCVLVAEELAKREQRDALIESLNACSDKDDLKDIIHQIKKIRFEGTDFEEMAATLKKAFNRITGFTLSIEKARKEIAHVPTEDDLPPWVKRYVYIQHTGVFYDRATGAELDYKAFDATYSRYLNGASAVDFALNKAQIKAFYMQMYKPDEDEEFWFQGHECVNYFSDRLMAVAPGKLSKADLHTIAIVERHLENMLPDERDRALFVSYLAYIVQTYQRANWMVCLQGVEGDGKSFFAIMMAAILGGSNVRTLDAPQLEDRYTGWAVGQLMCFIEELRMQGHNRFDVLNKIKPFITNQNINVHPKNVNPYTAYNTTAYVAFTNHMNALPLGDNDRRYCILKSRWQIAEDLRKFLDIHPGYFEELFGTVDGPNARPGALRQWLLEYELHSDFDPKGRAPLTSAREEMIGLSKSDAQTAFEEALEEDNHPQISKELVTSSALAEFLYDNAEEPFSGKAIATFLTDNGYAKLPFRVRVSSDSDNKASIWVRDRKRFQGRSSSDQRLRMVKFLGQRQRLISHRDDI